MNYENRQTQGSTWTPGLEMLYENAKPAILYRNKKYLPLPRGTSTTKNGYGNAIFFLCPSQNDTITELSSDYEHWFFDMYRLYTTDSYFRAKIGKKHINANMNQVLRRDWMNTKFPHPLKYVPAKQRKTMLGAHKNVIVDLGEWTHFYFEYSLMVTIPVIVQNYVNFLVSKLNDPDYDGYKNKLVLIPINTWFGDRENTLGFTRKMLNNPLSILLYASYRYPDIFAQIPEVTFLLVDSKNDQFMMFRNEDFSKNNFNKIKIRLKSLSGFTWDEKSEATLDLSFTPEEEDQESELNNQVETSVADPHNIVGKPAETDDEDVRLEIQVKQENRTRLLNEVKRSFIGDAVDTPAEVKQGQANRPAQPIQKEAQITTKLDMTKAATPPKVIRTPMPKDDKKSDQGSSTQASHNEENAKIPSSKPQTSPSQKRPRLSKSDVGNPVVPKNLKAIDDVTLDYSVYTDEDLEAQAETPVPLVIDDEYDEMINDAVDEELAKMKEDDPDVLLNRNNDLTADKIISKVAGKIVSTYVPPKKSEADIKRMESLKATQATVIRKMPTAEQVKSKVVDQTDLSKVIRTINPNLTKLQFNNFDKNYTEKKLQTDIDSVFTTLSHAEVKVFVVSKEEEDTSDQLNLKKTATYHLEDEFGGKHTIKFDIPIIVDDKYIYLNGSRLLLQHQMVMMPIVKSTPNQVQIVTWYRKVTLVREGMNDTRTMSVKKYMTENNAKFNIAPGNAVAKNKSIPELQSTLDIDMYARQFMSFHIGHNTFIMDREELERKIKSLYPNAVRGEGIPVGYNTDTKQILYVTPSESLTDLILKKIPKEAKQDISDATKVSARKLLRTEIFIMRSQFPLIILLCFFEGLTSILKKAHIEFMLFDKIGTYPELDMSQYAVLECGDKYIVWERNPIWNSMLMNGFAEFDLTQFSFEELDDRDTYANILSNFYTSRNIIFSLLQFKDFMIDEATIEILTDYNLPTDFIELLLLGNQMLADNNFTPINDQNIVRLRSNEIIAQAVYETVTDAYKDFRQTQSKMGRNRKPDRINVKQSAILDAITKDSSLTNEASDLNPILELEKARSVTPRGPRGVGKERAMTLPKRAYDPTMLGIVGITTSPDAKVGVTRQLTLEPNIKSTRGYTKITDKEDLEDLKNVNLLTPAELLSPPGVLHDDGPRTAMGYKQSQYMLPVAGSTPVFFGNKVESVVPYHMSRAFVIAAKEDGSVVEIKDGVFVVQYKDGTYDSFDTNPQMKKNSSSGFYIKTQMDTTLKNVGDTFKKNEIIANDSRAFTKNTSDRGASMNIGVPIKVAILPNYDIYEDAGPISTKLSEKFTAYMSMKEEVAIPAASFIEKMVDIGDRVEVNDPLIIYDEAHEDEETNAFLAEIRSKLGEQLEDVIDIASMPQVRTKYAGTISNIEVFSSVPLNELSPSLQELVKKFTAKSKRINSTLQKYSNEGDMKYFKCGQLITNSPDVVKPDYQNRVKGVRIGNDGRGVVIFFYIEFKDIAKTGDKGSAFTALKFVTSHVIPKGREPYSEYRPDEEISTVIAPGAILARKTPSIWTTMATNKCIIEIKRHALDLFFEDKDF